MNSQARKQFRAYFLGELGEPEALKIEMQCFQDDEVAEQIFVVEEDLIEAYLSGKLANRELQHFESNYLTTAGRRSRVELLSRLKNESVVKAKQPVKLAEASFGRRPILTRFFRAPNHFWSPLGKFGLALGSILFLLVLSFGLFRFLTHPAATSELRSAADSASQSSEVPTISRDTAPSPNYLTNAAPSSQTPELSVSKQLSDKTAEAKKLETKKESSVKTIKQNSENEVRRAAPSALAATLFPGTLRDDEAKTQYVRFSPDAKVVDINLASIKSRDEKLRVELQTIEGAVLWQQNDIPAQSENKSKKTISIKVPIDVLKEETYIIIVSDADGQVADYSFRATTKVVKRQF